MEDGPALLDRYRALADVSGRMLLAARNGDWDAVIALDADYTARASAVTDAALPPLPPPLAADVAALIRKLMAEEGELRMLLGPQLAHLSSMLSDAGAQRKLAGAYGT
jgi:flagellar protein FliT